ncbi:MAG: VWA domain-containing protein [Fusobacteria bacterium]|nr:VWA domain-containing protein [Fusobacteriota bacterium]
MEFNFEKIDYIYIMLFFILIIFFLLGYNKKRKGFSFFNLKFKTKWEVFKLTGLILSLGFIIFALFEPKIEKETVSIKKEGLDIYFLIDVSNSMDAEDLKPSRMHRAKEIVQEVINNLQGDRIGFIPFSSDAYIQMPLTDDYTMGRLFLDVVDTNMIYGGGTNIEKAIKIASESFSAGTKGDRVIILFSDGEEHDERVIALAKTLNNIKIYTIGIGTQNGGPIPIYEKGNLNGYLKDKNGETVITKLNISTLEEISNVTGGKFYLSTLFGDEIKLLIDDISKLKKSEIKNNEIKIYTHLFQYFLLIGLLLFIIFYILL